MTNMNALNILEKLDDESRHFSNAPIIYAKIAKGDMQEESFKQGEAGADCDELRELYEFRLRNVGAETGNLGDDLKFLLGNLGNMNGQRCFLASLTDGGSRYSVFFNSSLDKVIGCIRLDVNSCE